VVEARPGSVPVDTKQTSDARTKAPAKAAPATVTFADPGNAKPAAAVWDTNPPKHQTGKGSTEAEVPSGGGAEPASTEADPGAVGQPVYDSAPAIAPPPPLASRKGGNRVRWDPRVPPKEVADMPSRSRP